MTFKIHLSGRAIDDLRLIQRWVAEQADVDVAEAYIARIEAKFQSLTAVPTIGPPRDDLIPGLRTLAFERRLSIASRATGNDVWIERIVSSARNEGAFR
jgi:toxin ParE1/3/4